MKMIRRMISWACVALGGSLTMPVFAAEPEQLSYWVVLSNAGPGKDQEFKDWYISRHIPEILAEEGMVSAQFFQLGADQPSGEQRPYNYLTIYEVKSASLPHLFANLDTIRSRVTPPPKDAFAPGYESRAFTPLTRRLDRTEVQGKSPEQVLKLAVMPTPKK